MANAENQPRVQIDIAVGADMSERILYFQPPSRPEQMQPIVARLLSRDMSFRPIPEAEMADEESRHKGKLALTVKTTDSSDWTSPALVNGIELVGDDIQNKTDLAREAVRFAIISIEAGEELAA